MWAPRPGPSPEESRSHFCRNAASLIAIDKAVSSPSDPALTTAIVKKAAALHRKVAALADASFVRRCAQWLRWLVEQHYLPSPSALLQRLFGGSLSFVALRVCLRVRLSCGTAATSFGIGQDRSLSLLLASTKDCAPLIVPLSPQPTGGWAVSIRGL